MNAAPPINVLLVEDSPTDTLLTQEALSPPGQFRLRSSERLGEALRLLSEAQFDVVLLDLGLPDSQGLDTLRQLRNKDSKVAVVVLTGKNDEELAMRALENGAKDYLVKGQAGPGELGRAIRYAQKRGKVEEALRASEELFRSAFDYTNVATVLTDMSNRFVRVNAAFARMFGYSEAEMLTISMPDVTHPDDLTASFAGRVDLLAGRSHSFQTEKRYLHKDGHILWGLTNVSLVRDTTGKPTYYIGQVQNITERKRAESQRRESADLLAAVANGTTDAVFVKDRAGRYLLFNAAAAAFVGRTVEDVLGKDDTALFDPAGARLVMERDRRVMESGRVETEEETLTAAGVTRTYQATKGPYRDAAGNVIGVIGISRDITEMRRLAAERDAVLRRLQFYIDRMPLAYILFDADLRVAEWNPTAERIFGFTREEMLGKGPPYEDLVARAFWPRAQEILNRIRAGDMDAHSLNENRTKDGRTIVCQWYNTPLVDDGNFTGFLCLAQDVSEQKRMEEQVRQAQQRLEHVVASSPAVLFTLSIADGQIGTINWISANLREVFGYPAEAALNPDWWLGNIHPEDRDRIIAQTQAGLFNGGRTTHEYRFRHGDGSFRWTRGELRLIRDATGQPAEIVGAWSDITERKNLEDQFRQAQKMEAVGQLAGGIAHDFNNLLTVISGYSEMLLSALPARDRNRGKVEQIFKAGERAALLTRQLLTFSRKEIVEPKVLDLNLVVDDACKMLRRLIGEDIRLTTVPAHQLDRVVADAGQVEQVLMNLAVNARDAMPQGGRLTIETNNVELDEEYAKTHAAVRPGRYVLLAMTDTGNGMTDEVKAKAFEPFFTTKPVGKGTGLGLATVYGIVKQAGGHIAVYSEVGRGTTFKAYFPSAGSAFTSAEASAAARATPTGRGTILLVEDDDQVRDLTRALLESLGYNVLEARDGAAAVRACAAHQGTLDLLITDVVMPGLSGREVAEAVRNLRPGIKVLYVSGYTDDAVVRHGVLRADDAFLQKPFTTPALGEKVRDVLGLS